jgi:RNA polymerase sigma factor (sigma-70 family)
MAMIVEGDMTDWELLKAYRVERGERAEELFGEIVGRHVDLVYSVARRRMGEEHLARDVTQEVFLTLAQKGRTLGEGVLLTGWLFETTRFVCLGMKRAEERRRQRELETAMRETDVAGEEAMWGAIAGEVDEAVGALGKRDREVVLLRYFEGKTHGELAAALAISEDAAKKRVERAVEALRRVLTGRGKTVTGVGLGVMLGTHAVRAAPGSVAGAVVQAIRIGAKPVGLAAGGGVMSVAAMKVAAAVLVVAVGVPVGFFALRPVPGVKAGGAKEVGVAASVPVAATEAAKTELRGDVVGADGKPVAGATVTCQVFGVADWEVVGSAQSDRNGHFVLKDPGKEGRIYAFLPGVGVSKPIGIKEKVFHFQLAPAVDLMLTMLTPEGKPAEGLEVHPTFVIFREDVKQVEPSLSSTKEMQAGFAATTDASGRCVIHGLPKNARVRFDADDARYADFSVIKSEVALEGEGSPIIAKPIQLQKAATIAGQLINPETHQAISGMVVDAQTTQTNPSGGWGTGMTNEKGEFLLNRMLPGDYVVSLAETHGQSNELVAAALELKLAEGEHAAANFLMSRGGVLKGQVRDAETGEGLAGMAIGLMGPGRPETAAAVYMRTTDVTGHFEFRVPAGEQHPYFAESVPEGYLQLPEQGKQSVMVKEGETVETTFEMKPDRSPMAEGVVLDPQGNPVGGAMVTYELPNDFSLEPHVVTTDAQGKFRIHARKGTVVRAEWKEMATLTPTKINRASSIELQLAAHATFSVVVELVDSSGKPVAGATASLGQQSGQFGMLGQAHAADNLGRVRFEGLKMDGRYWVSAEAPGYGEAQANLNSGKVDDAQELTVRIVLQKVTSAIAGVVVDIEGKPLKDVDVWINGSTTGARDVRTDAAGKFVFHVVSGANGLIWIKDDGKNLKAVDGRAGQEDLKFVMTQDGGNWEKKETGGTDAKMP